MGEHLHLRLLAAGQPAPMDDLYSSLYQPRMGGGWVEISPTLPSPNPNFLPRICNMASLYM